jgi:hypothetical protein
MNAAAIDTVVLVSRSHATWTVPGSVRPLFVCAEMFLDLKDIERRRWALWETRQALRSAQREHATLCQFLRATDIDWLEQHGARFASRWYRDGSSDRSLYRGISLGGCLEYDVKARAIRVLKLAVCLQRLVEDHPQAKFLSDFAVDSTEGQLLEEMGVAAATFGAPNVPGAMAAGRQALTGRNFVLAKIRDFGLRFARMLSFACRIRPLGDVPTVVVRVGMQSSKMLERWLAASPKAFAVRLWMDYLIRPRTILAMVWQGASFVAPPPTRSREPAGLAAAREGALRTRSNESWLVGLTSSGAVQSALDRIVAVLADTAFDRASAAVDEAFDELARGDVALVVMPNDCQLVMRAWTLVARQCGTTSLVLQHGHLDYTEDGDHKCADYSAFWSPAVARQFLNGGLRPDQIVVTGSPNADEHVARRESAQRSSSRRGPGKPRIVIITTGNPGVQAYVEETWVCDYIVGVLDALAPRLSELSIEIKLHPGESSALYRRHLDSRLPEGIRIEDRGDLGRLVSQCDLIISPPSTVVVEARAAGTPVIMLWMPSANGRRSSLQDVEGVVTVRSYVDLLPAIDEVFTSPGSLPGGLPLEDFLGPMDAMSSERVLKAVEVLAKASASARSGHSPHRRGEAHAG